MVEIVCAECGKQFLAKGTGKRYRFCQRLCFERNHRKNHRAAYNARARRDQGRKRALRRNLVCQKCQKPFVGRRHDQKFCSIPCREKHGYKIHAKERNKKQLPKTRIYHRLARLHHQEATIVAGIKKRIKKKGLPFGLTYAWATGRWTKHCELTGLPFELGRSRLGPFSPSIDRIVPEKGYIQENCRFILLAVNALKHTGTDEQMYRIAQALIANRPADAEGVLSLPG